jgi:hypothetical protein
MRVTISVDLTLAYIDLLFDEGPSSPCRPLIAPGQPRLPVSVRFAGTGSYFSPWHVDTNDVIIQAIPQCSLVDTFIDAAWLNFIAELNNVLRMLQRRKISRDLVEVNKFLGDVWTMKPLGGLIVEFCVFLNTEYKPPASSVDSSRDERVQSVNARTDVKEKRKSSDRAVIMTTLDKGRAAPMATLEDFSSSRVLSSASADIPTDVEWNTDEEFNRTAWRIEKTPQKYEKMCDMLSSGKLLPGIVIYHPSVLSPTGAWNSSANSVPVNTPTPGAVYSPNRGAANEDDDEDESKANNPEPDSVRLAHYGARAASLEKFYNIVKAADVSSNSSANVTSPQASVKANIIAVDDEGDASRLQYVAPTIALAPEEVAPEVSRDSIEGDFRDSRMQSSDSSVRQSLSPTINMNTGQESEGYSSFPLPIRPTSKRSLLQTIVSNSSIKDKDAEETRPRQDSTNVVSSITTLGGLLTRFRAESDTSRASVDESEGPSKKPWDVVAAPSTNPNTAQAAPARPESTPRRPISSRLSALADIPLVELEYDVDTFAMWRYDKKLKKVVNVRDALMRLASPSISNRQTFQVSNSDDYHLDLEDAEKDTNTVNMFQWAFEQVVDSAVQLFHLALNTIEEILVGGNVYPRGPKFLRHILATLLEICCLFDFMSLAFIAVTYWCIWGNVTACDDNTGFYIIMGAWPGAMLIAPITGFAAIALGKMGTVPRMYSVWSRLATISFVNVVWIYLRKRDNAVGYLGLFLLAMGLSRLFQNYAVDIYIAHAESLRRTRGWDGLSTSIVVAQDNGDFDMS